MGILSKKLTKAEILEAEDRKPIDLEVPQWGGAVSLRPMSATARDLYTSWLHKNSTEISEIEPTQITAMTLKLLSLTMCDESGELMFSEDDIARLAAKSGEAIDRVFRAAQQINGIGTKAVAEQAKNSAPSPNANSHTD
jgi:hypothetical protein